MSTQTEHTFAEAIKEYIAGRQIQRVGNPTVAYMLAPDYYSDSEQEKPKNEMFIIHLVNGICRSTEYHQGFTFDDIQAKWIVLK